MPKDRRRSPLVLVPALLVVAGLVGAAVWFFGQQRANQIPRPDTKLYEDAISLFYVGTTALQTSDAEGRAPARLTTLTQLVRREPAAWANLGLYYLRSNDLVAARRNLEQAEQLAPNNSRIQALLGLLEQRQGRLPEAVARLRRAAELDPTNLRARYALVEALGTLGGSGSDAEARKYLEQIVAAQPGNVLALSELTRLAAKNNDRAALPGLVDRLEKAIGPLPASLRASVGEQLRTLRTTATGPNPRAAARQVSFLQNVAKQALPYRLSLIALQGADATQIGEPLTRPLALAVPVTTPAAPDTALSFTPAALGAGGAGGAATSANPAVVRSVSLTGEGAPALFVADAAGVRRAGAAPGTSVAALPPAFFGPAGPGPDSVAPLDFDYDHRNDLAVAGPGGFRLFKQNAQGGFGDATGTLRLPPAIANGSYASVYAVDIEADGDLDVLLGTATGAPIVLRNNGDGSVAVQRPFPGVNGLRGFVWADVDADGDGDPVMLDNAGALRVFTNQRSGQFSPRSGPPDLGRVVALAAADLNADGVMDIATLGAARAVSRVSDQNEGADWEVVSLARLPEAANAPAGAAMPQAARLFAADLDNNGGLDLVASLSPAEARVFLSDAKLAFSAPSIPVAGRVSDVADANNDGRLDLLGSAAAPGGGPARWDNKGAKNYHYVVLRTRSDPRSDPPAELSQADARINSFGVGGEIEVRSGLLVQKQPVTGPLTHFGLGENKQADVARIVWPNGIAQLQGEFELGADREVAAEQRLGGSCPYLFAWDGTQMAFVTDCIWRSPLGLKINALDTAGVSQTRDWIKIRGDQLKPRNGVYDLRVTAELWETHFFDQLALMRVDHPAGTEVWVDERLAFPQPPLEVIVTRPAQAVAEARDDHGNDVSEIVRAADTRYVDNFGRGKYQGVARDHYLEVALPNNAPAGKPLYLIAFGWIHPTDSSINVAIGQGKGNTPPSTLAIETPDAAGNWSLARPGLGFPTGKVKTVVLRVDDAFKPGAPRRLRLRTNLEIFWDQVRWAERLPATPENLRISPVPLKSADLRFRGFSIIKARDQSSPELPQSYEKLATTGQVWRDLVGYYTRFGDVRPLLVRTDDRYVIMNAGDEMRLGFDAAQGAAAPAPGWTRDYVLDGDGWVKDGNMNTTFSKTVLPLPTHDPVLAAKQDRTPPTTLAADPVYQRHPADWQTFHTRYVAPRAFQNALRDSDQTAAQAARQLAALSSSSSSPSQLRQEARRNER